MAARPPAQLAEPTVGTPAGCSPAVSTTTNGIDRRLQLAALRGVEVGQDEDDAARAAGQHVVEPLLAGPVRAAQLGEHDAQALGPGDGLDALDDLHGPAGVELVEDEVEEARSGLGAARGGGGTGGGR